MYLGNQRLQMPALQSKSAHGRKGEHTLFYKSYL